MTRQDRIVFWVAGAVFAGALALLGLQGPEPCLDEYSTACATPFHDGRP